MTTSSSITPDNGTLIVSGPELREKFCAAAAKSKTARLAVAFWGRDAIKSLGLERNGLTVQAVCNLRLGGTNPHEIRRLMEFAEVKQSDNLHSKIYLLDDTGFVGSSNVSSNGMGAEGKTAAGWVETNVMFPTGALYSDAMQTFEEIYAAARVISYKDLDQAAERWTERRKAASETDRNRKTGDDILSVLKLEPDRLIDRRIFVLAYDADERGATVEKVLDRERKEKGLKLDCFEDWNELPDDAFLIEFYLQKNESFKFNGFCRTPVKPLTAKVGRSEVKYVFEEDKIGGCIHGKDKDWQSGLHKLRKKRWKSDKAVVIELGDFARKFLNYAI